MPQDVLILCQGQEVELDMWAYTDNENTQPLPFRARFVPRDENIRGLVNEEADLARGRLKDWDNDSKVTLEQLM